MLRLLERVFESFLWNTRLIVLVAVLASLAVSLAVFFVTTVDVWYLVMELEHYAGLDQTSRKGVHDQTIKHVVQVVDGYLLATVLLIFSLGLYELFISRIDQADAAASSRILSIRNLDDLKNRLAKVILMILVVKFFDYAVGMKFKTPLDMLSFAGGIALIGLALYLSHAGEHKSGGHGMPAPRDEHDKPRK